jgi:hypothetical protein
MSIFLVILWKTIAETLAAPAVIAQQYRCYQLHECHVNLHSVQQLELVQEPLQPYRRKCKRLHSEWFDQNKFKYSRIVIYS